MDQRSLQLDHYCYVVIVQSLGDHAGITKPHLEQMVNALDSNSYSQADEEISWLDERSAEHVSMDSVDERVVLVHEVLFFVSTVIL